MRKNTFHSRKLVLVVDRDRANFRLSPNERPDAHNLSSFKANDESWEMILLHLKMLLSLIPYELLDLGQRVTQ